MTDDERAVHLLRHIVKLSLSHYPWSEGSNVHPVRAMVLGYIAGIAGIAAAQDPRFVILDTILEEANRGASTNT